MKKPLVLEEFLIWLHGRFTLTGEEKVWLLLVLIICWVGLVARYVHLKNQTPEPLSPQEVEMLLINDE